MAEPKDFGLPSLQKLQTAEQMELLDVVDSLRACGLSEIVALPQLIVCGDQSSGKSSVLEAISGIPFPKQDTLCTRFATEVILRRAEKVEISVSIVPGEDRALIDRDPLLRFRREMKTMNDFGDLFQSARNEMGLSSLGKSFSNDILRVEFCAPGQPQLTLVDLPGLIHSETNSQTAGDVKLVHNLVLRYLQNPRSIILAVVSAKNDISNQIILRNARNVDPRGLRTLGIITKPDLLVNGSKSEDEFITLARNEEIKFSLGWHVVKNLDSAISQNQQKDTRDQQETLFFQESGFNCLPAHTLGISFLRARLSKVLFSQVRRELPRLIEDIQVHITAARIARDKLGPSRSKPEQQREFLISLSQTFHNICRDAVKGDYDHEFFQDNANPERRLCANVMNMHYSFASNIRKNGTPWLLKHRSRNEAIGEACKLLKRSRGRELPGLPNPLLVGELFRQYSRPWGDLARLHIKTVWEATNQFLELLLQYLTDEDVCENVFRFWLHPIMEGKLKLAYSKLDELLEVHNDHPMTTNSHFINNSKTSRRDSSKKSLESMLRDRLQSGHGVSVDEISRMMSAITTKDDLDMDMVAAEEAFDNMNAYYEIAINLFTDNVPNLAVQAPIIREVPKIFCPTAVYSMNTEVIHCIAGETEEKIMERDSILRRLATLEKGASICTQYAKRPQHILKLSLDEIDQPELLVPGSKMPGNQGRETPGKPPSTRRLSPESLPKAGSTPNIFSHLSVPPQKEIGNSSRDPSPSALQRSGQKPTASRKDFTKPTVSGPANTGFGSGLFGSKSSSSDGNTAEKLSPIPSSGYNMNTKPVTSGVFGSKPSVAAGYSHLANATARPAFKDSSSTKSRSSSFSDPEHATPWFSSTPPSGAVSTSGATKPGTSTGASGLLAETTATKRDNSLKFPANNNTTTTTTTPSTLLIAFTPTQKIDSQNPKMTEIFPHISFIPEFIKFSCEELRFRDYEYKSFFTRGNLNK